jgi:hypothetical protein
MDHRRDSDGFGRSVLIGGGNFSIIDNLEHNMSTTNSGPDLTQRPPRSPRVRLGDYVLLPRILDKGRASLAGKLGEYHFGGTGMDRHFFTFTGIQFEALKAEIAKGGGDGELLGWVNSNAKPARQPWEITAWSNFHEHRTPDSDAETLEYFAKAVAKLSAGREDIATWFALMDLDDHCTFGGKA